MTTFPGSPRVMKGAIIGLDPLNPIASIIIFQYNPDTLRRTLQAQAAGGTQDSSTVDRSEALRLRGAPVESITLDVDIDATDQLATGDPVAASMGVYPQLSALEMLLYPKSSLVIANTVLALTGSVELIPPEAPLTLFVWGPKRVLPVRLSEFTITEEAYDVDLNPIRASVNLGLRVLSYSDLSLTNPGYYLFLAHQVTKEVMAELGSTTGVVDLAMRP
jgi:hypothetical protein